MKGELYGRKVKCFESFGGGKAIVDIVYPVGSIYMSVNSTSPADLFGGTWEQLKDRFLLAAGDSYSAESTGGEATHTLTVSELPSHNHSGSTGSSGNHYHYVNQQDIYGNLYADTISDGSRLWWHDNHHNVGSGGAGMGGWRGDRNNKSMIMRIPGHNTNSNGSHTHSFTTGSTGSGSAHNNMPPYLAVYMWKRTA